MLHNYQTKLSVFLVERVPLVFQQARAIENECDLRVGHYCGQMGVDLWGSLQWSEIMEKKDVLVMTAQIFLNMLRHGLVSLNRVGDFMHISLSLNFDHEFGIWHTGGL